VRGPRLRPHLPADSHVDEGHSGSRPADLKLVPTDASSVDWTLEEVLATLTGHAGIFYSRWHIEYVFHVDNLPP
jgi:hypothetical protein